MDFDTPWFIATEDKYPRCAEWVPIKPNSPSSSGGNVELSQGSVDKWYNATLGYCPTNTCPLLAWALSQANILPSQLRTHGIEGLALHPFATTPSSDVSEGRLNGEAVALKTFRRTLTQPGEEEDLFRLFFEFEVAQRAKSHPSILPMLGIHIGPSGEIYLVSKLMKNGPLSHYLESHPEADKLDILVRLADAVTFLHELSHPIIHGDIRALNVLVGDAGEPLLMDFGISSIMDPATSQFEPKCHANVGNVRWTPKEKISETEHPLTPKADCFSFASLILEVFSGDVPYAHLRSDGAVVVEVMVRNKLPPRPSSLEITDHLWDLMLKCWSVDPADRPAMREIRDFLISMQTDDRTLS